MGWQDWFSHCNVVRKRRGDCDTKGLQRLHVFSHMWNTDPIQTQQYYEKQVTLRGGHICEREGKRRKLRR
jgi:hypothetical protein